MTTAIMPAKPYRKTGKILFDSLLFTLHGYGCESISHDNRVITCTRAGQQYSIITSGETTCIDILVGIGLLKPQPPRPAKQQNIRDMSEQSYNKTNKHKRGSKKRHAA